ncbi:cobyric acid synthase [Halorarum halobium]|uniref:cobyric acid synthase n=1 Tax=Halorarum halobium TaxID=3075121 RepID=UPI0028AD18F2|nr:cobyric acid synthase [Halobaculum sp. XH14]
MTRTLLVAGTASHVGKSTVVAGLCRLLADRGVSVAPFKAQNMSNNARAAATPEGGWGEIGVSQYVQARAARVTPTTDTNPVLLKPRGDRESQLVVDGEAVGHYEAGTYYDEHWERARRAAAAAHDRLAAEHDVVVAEGAGSIAEINLHDRDLANLETARFADADVLLVVDIERGGAFASLYGTVELLPGDVRERVVGALVNKFRGDVSLLSPGIEEFESMTGVPVVGVLPYDDPGLPAEDSVSLPAPGGTAVRGADDGVAADRAVTVAVPRLPRVSNFTDLEPLAREPGVRVAYVPLDDDLSGADALVLPGTKNTVDDLLALREAGFGDALAAFEGPVVGLCGGYQLLGERLTNAAVEGTTGRDDLAGFGLLPVETRFSPDKRVEAVTRELDGSGPLAGARGTVTGYEIHMGESIPVGDVDRPLGPGSAATERALGTYLHGLFENRIARDAFLDAAFAAAGTDRPTRSADEHAPFDAAAELIRTHVDLERVGLERADPGR